MERAKTMIKSNTVIGLEVIPCESSHKFKIRFTSKYQNYAFLGTSYSNTTANKARTFATMKTALSTLEKISA
jgi:hypothetical protein